MNYMANLRKSKELLVHIVEQHNDAVPPIHRAVASRLLPFSNAAMIHLDSHPDLLIPVHMPAETVFKPSELYESLSIENWLVPLVFAKHFDHIVWVKPPWANQIPVSKQRFLVGQCTQSGCIRVTSKENYFLTDGLFRPSSELSDHSMLILQVEEVLPQAWAELNPSYPPVKPASKTVKQTDKHPTKEKTWIQRIHDSVKDKPYVLDVDLDFFSTANPFRDVLEPEEEQALRRLYHYTTPRENSDESIASFTSLREEQLDSLEAIFTELEKERLKCEENRVPGTGDSMTSNVDILSSMLDSARELGMEETKIPDLSLLCRAVVHRSSLNSKTISTSSSAALHNSSAVSYLSVQPHNCLTSSSSSTLTISHNPTTPFDSSRSCELSNSSSVGKLSNPATKQPDISQPLTPSLNIPSPSTSEATVSLDPSLPSKSQQPSNNSESNSMKSNHSTLPLHIPKPLSPTKPAESLTFLQLHDFGCTLDDTDLPHHLSSPAQVGALMSEVRLLLEALPRPALVTIARSSDDGYCPKVEVDHYERDVLKMLEEIFGPLKVSKLYESLLV
ncbi:upf0489 protein c5orf22 homolog [Plakobranchus ocellatus]|uniref:Upf0489 protein c5orf22 homolog n=1 Tax=Plakobranchus ocellatus TaxID=259542 RepID=A0AAV4C2V3_9GAST|nr:upf0489 protein c5orf22 homolog [Plakobranchus ocellatus]